MIKSMTGYGRASLRFGGWEYTAELRSVNNRYLDCTVKLPRMFSYAEERVKQLVKETISRGKVDVFLSVTNTAGDDLRISVNRPVLEGYLQAMRTIAKDYQVQDDISVASLAGFQDIFLIEKQEEDQDSRTEEIVLTVSEAIRQFEQMRITEGQALADDLRSRGQTVLALVERVEARSPVTVAEYRTRLEAKMKEILASTSIDEGRILTEAALFADKIAVDEETVRLRSHLRQMDSMLAEGGAIGRKLDFLLQEMNREANTIGSKGNDLEQARTVVEIKAELEKIREQTQNIE